MILRKHDVLWLVKRPSPGDKFSECCFPVALDQLGFQGSIVLASDKAELARREAVRLMVALTEERFVPAAKVMSR